MGVTRRVVRRLDGSSDLVENRLIISRSLRLLWRFKWQLRLAGETIGEGALCTPQSIHWATSLSMTGICMTEPEDFPGPTQAKFFQNLCLFIRVELTPGAVDLDGGMDRMRA